MAAKYHHSPLYTKETLIGLWVTTHKETHLSLMENTIHHKGIRTLSQIQ